MKKLTFNTIAVFNLLLLALVTMTLQQEPVTIKKPSSREVFNFTKKHPKISDNLAEHLIMYKDCYKLIGYITSMTENEISWLENLIEYKDGRCFKRTSNINSEISSESLALTTLSTKIHQEISKSGVALRNLLALFSRLSKKFKKEEDIIANNQLASSFLLSQAQVNSCIIPGIKEIYFVSAKRRSLLFATLTELQNGCVEENGIFINCVISNNDFSKVWKAWESISKCLLSFYNNVALYINQAMALVSQYQICRVDGNSNMEATSTARRILQNKLKFKFFSPRKNTNCASKIIPKYHKNELLLDINEIILKEETVETVFTQEKKKIINFRKSLLVSQKFETCYQDRVYFTENGKYILPLKDESYYSLKSAINSFNNIFLTSNINVDALVFKTNISSIISNESDYDPSCSSILDIIQPQFYNINKLIKLISDSQTLIFNTSNPLWFFCKFDKSDLKLKCKCYLGDCPFVGQDYGTDGKKESQFLFKIKEFPWLVSYETLTISIFKTSEFYTYFSEYSIITSFDQNLNEVNTGVKLNVVDKKYEFNVNGKKSNTDVCSQMNGCNKIGLSSENTKKEKQSCFGKFKDTCRWDLNLELAEKIKVLQKINASEVMPFRNMNLQDLSAIQLNFISSFLFDGFNINPNFIIDAPNAISIAFDEYSNASDLNNLDLSTEILPDLVVKRIDSEELNTQITNKRNLIEFGDIFDYDKIQIPEERYKIKLQSNDQIEIIIEGATMKSLGNITNYFYSYENSLFTSYLVVFFYLNFLFLLFL